MALILTVDRAALHAQVDAVAVAFPGLVPVVKGNGYGFGRPALARLALERTGAAELAVGTVHELHDVVGARRLVLTPALAHEVAAAGPDDVLTVGQVVHVHALATAGWRGAVMVKLASSMLRFGATVDELPALLATAEAAGLAVHGVAIHLPLAGTPSAHAAEVEAWLPRVPAHLPVHVSHLDAEAYAGLRRQHPSREWRIRLGTALWLGDKSFLHLSADVVQTHPIAAGEPAGYRATPAPCQGRLVIVSAGSAHGVAPLPDGRSPFHYARQRLALLEPPHMHSSMLFVPEGQPSPAIGDDVDVQRPLTQVTVDIVRNGPGASTAQSA